MNYIIITFLLISFPILAKVDAPDYSFTFDKLAPILPGKNKKLLDKKTWPLKLINKEQMINTYEGKLHHKNYNFTFFISTENEKILELFVKLPSYFLHDLFHQSLINRFKKQNKFYNQNSRSIYIWNNTDIGKITYTANCTITCFPDFLHIISKEKSLDKKFNSFILKMLK